MSQEYTLETSVGFSGVTQKIITPAAELSLDQTWAIVDDLIEAHGDWLPHYF